MYTFDIDKSIAVLFYKESLTSVRIYVFVYCNPKF